MAAAADLSIALEAVRAVSGRSLSASDAELLADLDVVEQIGRIVDGLRVLTAAEVERRSPKHARDVSLASREGARDAANLVADVARVSVIEARRRIGVGCALAPDRALLGTTLPSRSPGLTDAVRDGSVGLESARIVLETIQQVRRRAPQDGLNRMVEDLTTCAGLHAPDLVRVAATAWQTALDSDGPQPDERGRNPGRRFRLGRLRGDGAQSFSGVLDPEHRAALVEALQSRRRGMLLGRSTPGGDEHGSDCGTLEAEWHAPGDTRSRAQADYDTIAEILTAGLHAETDGHASTASVHEIVITATTTDIEARHGQGWAPGVMTGLPIPTVERLACTGTRRLLVTSPEGEPLHLSRRDRVFSPAQKRALLAASGGRCAAPGCTTSAAFLEAHHILWWQRDHGPTDIDNGVELCGHHHAMIHAPQPALRIERHDGILYIRRRGHHGPPQTHERARHGSLRTPARAA